MLKNMKLGKKFLLAFLCVGLIPFAVIGFVAVKNSSTALEHSAFNELEAVRGIKKAQIESFYAKRKGDMGVLMETVSTLREEAVSKLVAVRDVKKSQVSRYFKTIQGQILTFSENQMVVDAMGGFSEAFRNFRSDLEITSGELKQQRQELKTYYTNDFTTEYKKQNEGNAPNVENYFNQLDDDSIALQYQYIKANKNPLGSKHLLDRAEVQSRYSKLHSKVHPIIRDFLEKFGYYDIFLVDPDTGDIVYSVFKELDYTTSLIDGPYAQTNFGEAFRKANELTDKDAFVLVDYKQYPPSYEAAAGFIASPIYDGEKKIGILMFQMPIDRLNEIMSERSGLGKTGETILVGPDYLMRSDSYLDPKNRSVNASFKKPATGKVYTIATRDVHEHGKTGVHYVIDYRKQPTIIAYTPLDIGGVTWCLNAKMDVAEAFCPVDSEGKEFFAKYQEMYGYYDLFLIDPSGFCFYSVAKETDYQTNLVDGKFSSSNLGNLTREVLKTKEFGLVDFAPYAPSNNEPAAFIAQPEIHEGKVEVVVALQLSLDAINKIMGGREGMGETGETYLVGSDKLMRSDSFLDPKHHTVVASFADPSKGSVDTEAVREAIAGKTESKIIINYNGNPVLSSYAPLKIGNTTWAILAEIDEAEAFAPIKTLEWIMGIIAIIGIAAIVAVALIITRSITGPIQKSVDFAQAMASGDFSQELEVGSADEIGDLGKSLNQMALELGQMVKEITENANQLAGASEELSTVSAQMASNSDETAQQSQNVAGATEEMSTNIATMAAAAEEMSTNVQGVSSAAEQMSTNVNTVASAIEEMSASIKGVAENAQEAGKVSGDATEKSKVASGTMQTLADAAREIGQVIEDIKRIAEQTNLLALNATIEAASAGDAGRGFAVVANEVKELANQSAQAAENITQRIDGVQKSTGDAVSAIEEIAHVINNINELQSSIAVSVDEQNKTANEIANNVAEAAKGTNNIASSVSEVAKGSNEVSKNAGEAAKGANEVSSNIQGVNQAARDTSAGAGQINNASNDLAKMAGQLQEMVKKFKV